MNKVFVINNSIIRSSKVRRWVFAIFGLIFLVNGVLNIYRELLGWFGVILGLLFVVLGLFYLFRAIFASSESSVYSPKIRIGDDFIEYKTDIFKPVVRIPWKDIRSIGLSAYQIRFETDGAVKELSYDVAPDISIAIKRAIREKAGETGVAVSGG
jgi:hypothetical protein